jgi:hypothetical protein
MCILRPIQFRKQSYKFAITRPLQPISTETVLALLKGKFVRERVLEGDVAYSSTHSLPRKKMKASTLSIISRLLILEMRHALVQLDEALRYKPEGRGFDSRCHWNSSLP